ARASGERRPRTLDRSVPVAVRLHDRAQAPAVREFAGQPGAVALHRSIVDDRDGTLDGYLGHAPNAAGSAEITSVATTDSTEPTRSAAILPARWCAWTPAQTASKGSMPRDSSAPIVP